MTQRRTFFAARPVQQVPGNTVQLLARLRPQAMGAVGVAAAPAGPGASACSGWLLPLLCATDESMLNVSVQPDGRTEMHGLYDEPTGADYTSLEASLWTGVPLLLDSLGRARPIPGDGFICDELQLNTTDYLPFPGRQLLAMAPGCIWTVAWDSAVSDPLTAASGHKATVAAGVLYVGLLSTDTSTSLTETLTATANAGTTQVARLVLRTRRIAA